MKNNAKIKPRILLPFVFELYSECKVFEKKNKTLTIKNVFLAATLLMDWSETLYLWKGGNQEQTIYHHAVFVSDSRICAEKGC